MQFDQDRLDVLAQGGRLTEAAMEHVEGANEAGLLVHGVLARALDGIIGPVSRGALDADLGRALRARAT